MTHAQFFSHRCAVASLHVNCCSKYYCHRAPKSEKQIHPFRNIHPWKSRTDFINSLLENVLYNKDGLVALNKPYGISSNTLLSNEGAINYQNHHIVNAANYTLSECLPNLAQLLGYEKLQIAKAPEKYMSGVILLAANERIEKAVSTSKAYATANKILCATYWIVTANCPNQSHGQYHLAVTLQTKNKTSRTVPVLLSDWSRRKAKMDRVHPVRVEFNTISKSPTNLSSLVEVTLNRRKWHTLRLFASTILYSPILGDNIHGSRIHKLRGSWLLLDPFHPLVGTVPTLDKQLLQILRVPKQDQNIIPVHAHLKSYFLPKFCKKEDIFIDSPLMPPFDWTCQQLQLKLTRDNEESVMTVN